MKTIFCFPVFSCQSTCMHMYMLVTGTAKIFEAAPLCLCTLSTLEIQFWYVVSNDIAVYVTILLLSPCLP